jgi:uncharacterized protein (DUF1501 family)
MNRRKFITQAGGMIASLGAMSQIARATGTYSNRKVLVCIYLFGGNDCWNLVGPTTDTAAKDGYNLFRTGELRREEFIGLLNSGNNVGMGLDPAIAAALNGLAQTVGSAVGSAVIGGVGPMAAKPLIGQGAPPAFPPRVASHEDQTEQWQAAMKQPFDFATPRTGFAGRLMQQVSGQVASDFGCVSFFGANSFQNCGTGSPQINPVSLPASGGSLPGKLMANAGTIGNGFWGGLDPFAQPNPPSGMLIDSVVSELMNAPQVNRHAELFARRYEKARALYGSNGLSSIANATISSGRTYSVIEKQLLQVAQMIKSPPTNPLLNRQTFFVGIGGFDTHGGDNAAQLAAVATAITTFFGKLTEGTETDSATAVNLKKQVTVFTASEFGRSLLPNGNGTDHAWGGHHLVVGGAVRSGFYGVYPTNILSSLRGVKAAISNDSKDEAFKEPLWTRNSSGMIPTPPHYKAIYTGAGTSGWLQPHISTDEYYAELAAWFLDCPDLVSANSSTPDGVIRDTLLPNLANLGNDDNPALKLGFLV